MPTILINKQTGQPDPLLKDGDYADALLSGTHTLPAGEIEVRNPDGKEGTVPSDKALEAMQSGYQIIGPVTRAIEDARKKYEGPLGSAKVFFTQMADEAALGVPETAWELTADPLKRAQWEAVKKDKDLANIAGGTVGAGLSLLFGGPLFKGATKAGEITAKATEATAARIAEKAGYDISKRQATRIAKDIVSKAAGGGVEGAIIASPHALTEAALGDPQLGGEGVLWGGGLGAMFGAGGGAAAELLGLGKKGAKAGYEWLEGKAPTYENMRDKIGKIFHGVDEDVVKHYIPNAERINANADRTAFNIMDDIDTARAKYMDEELNLSSQLGEARAELKKHYGQSLQDLKDERPAFSLAKEILDDLDETNLVLGQHSAEADDILANAMVQRRGKGTVMEPVSWSRADVLGRVTKELNELGPIAGEKKAAVKAYLDTLYGQIKEGYAERIDGPLMRDLMRTMRSENKAYWDRVRGDPGAANEYMETALRGLSEGMSDSIKRKVPLYAEKMEVMAPLVKSLKDMEKRFGTIDRAVNALRGVTGEKGEILEGVLKHYEGLRGKSFTSQLDAYKRAKELVRQSKFENLTELLLPNMVQKVKDLESELSVITSRNAPLKMLSPGRTQPIIDNMKRKVPNEKARRALEYLSDLEGKKRGVDDYLTQIQDRHTLDAFDIERINGSRRTNLLGALGAAAGGALGGVFGGPAMGGIGAALGATAGAGLDIYGGKILKRMLDGESFVGPLFVEGRFKAAGEKLDQIPGILKNLSESKLMKRMPKPTEGARLKTIEWLTREEMDASRDRDKHKQGVEKLNTKLSEWSANPAKLASDVDALVQPLMRGSAPQIGAMAAQKITAAVNYLASSVPKPPRAPSPFAPETHWKPSDYETKKFEAKVEVVNDPFAVLSHLQNGTLTPSHVNALKSVYPVLYSKIKERIYGAVSQGKIDLNYTDRVKLSYLLDEPLDINMTPQRIQTYQSTFQPPAEGGQPAPAAASGQPMEVSQSLASATASDLTRRMGE